jgi:prepilin-type N-terminal cleavage/methylation domain-containing protein
VKKKEVQKMLAKFTKNNEKGFTLIELMIVIAIIGILAAIAIPQFAAYRQRSYNAAANADLRNAATAQEAYYVDEQSYSNSTATLTGATYGLYLSDDVQFVVDAANRTSYRMRSWHLAGNKSFIIRGPGGSVSQF